MTIKNLVYQQVIYALQQDLSGDEAIMKEVWEVCRSEEERREAENELRKIIRFLFDQSLKTAD